MKIEEVVATRDVAAVAGNQFQDAPVGFPENTPMTVRVLAQAENFEIPNAARRTEVQMVYIAINPEAEPAADSNAWRPVRVAQGALSNAIGLVGAAEWTAARDNGTQWRIVGHRDAPTRDQERQGLRGTMRFRLA